MPAFTILDIAIVCHEANRAYCQCLGDESQKPWREAPDWQRDSAVAGVRFHLANPDAGAAASHDEWLRVVKANAAYALQLRASSTAGTTVRVWASVSRQP